MKAKCVHSCKGFCSALEVAERQEEQALAEYKRFAADCDYPDVREVLETLIREREAALRLLREKREMLTARFATIDRINDSFA